MSGVKERLVGRVQLYWHTGALAVRWGRVGSGAWGTTVDTGKPPETTRNHQTTKPPETSKPQFASVSRFWWFKPPNHNSPVSACFDGLVVWRSDEVSAWLVWFGGSNHQTTKPPNHASHSDTTSGPNPPQSTHYLPTDQLPTNKLTNQPINQPTAV